MNQSHKHFKLWVFCAYDDIISETKVGRKWFKLQPNLYEKYTARKVCLEMDTRKKKQADNDIVDLFVLNSGGWRLCKCKVINCSLQCARDNQIEGIFKCVRSNLTKNLVSSLH